MTRRLLLRGQLNAFLAGVFLVLLIYALSDRPAPWAAVSAINLTLNLSAWIVVGLVSD